MKDKSRPDGVPPDVDPSQLPIVYDARYVYLMDYMVVGLLRFCIAVSQRSCNKKATVVVSGLPRGI
jgi:hypothetical protein